MAVTDSSTMSATVELDVVKRELAALEDKEKRVRENLSRVCLQTAQQLQASGTGRSGLDIAERPLPNLLQEATILDAGVKYIDALEVMCCRLLHSACCSTNRSLALLSDMHELHSMSTYILRRCHSGPTANGCWATQWAQWHASSVRSR